MKIGLTYTSKSEILGELQERGLPVADDALEEYDSQETVDALVGAIRSNGHEVELLGWGRRMLARLVSRRPDLVFNIAEGLGGRSREAQVPAVLEMLGIPFVGSDALALAVSLDKQAAKDLVRAAGLAVPKGFLITDASRLLSERSWRGLDYPLIVKPSHEGSSRGISGDSVAWDDAGLRRVVDHVIRDYDQPALVEEYIWGREVTVGIVGDPPRVLGVLEIEVSERDRGRVYSLEVKRYSLESRSCWRAPLETPSSEASLRTASVPSEAARVVSAALAAFRALGCRDVSRVDFRLRSDGCPVFLEINPLPGLSPSVSNLAFTAQEVGLSYEELIGEILDGAIRRYGLRS